MLLRLQGHRRLLKKPHQTIFKQTWLFDMYTNIGANAIHLGSPNKTQDDIFGEFWKDLQYTKQPAPTTSTKKRAAQKRHRLTPEKKRVTRRNCSSVSSDVPLSPSERLLVCSEPQESSQRTTTDEIEVALPLGQDDVLEIGSIGSRSVEPASGFTGAFFTTINQREYLQGLGRQSLDQMMFLSDPNRH